MGYVNAAEVRSRDFDLAEGMGSGPTSLERVRRG